MGFEIGVIIIARVNYTNIYIDLVEPRLEEIAHYREMGATKEELAKMLGINADTLLKLARKFPELGKTLLLSKRKLVMQLEKKVIELALEGDKACLFKCLEVLAPDMWLVQETNDSVQNVLVVNDLKALENKSKQAEVIEASDND